LKAKYLDIQPSMRLADEPNHGAIWYIYLEKNITAWAAGRKRSPVAHTCTYEP
jgi:hypothetical protein